MNNTSELSLMLPSLELRGPDGTLLQEGEPIPHPDPTIASAFSLISTYTAEEDGTYYLSGSSDDADETGEYLTIAISLAPNPDIFQLGAIEDADAAAGANTAYSIEWNEGFLGEISPAGDEDWVAIDLQAGESYIFAMLGFLGDGDIDGLPVNLDDIDIPDLGDLPGTAGDWDAWSSGDPHLSTLDGVGYDFQAAGEYVLLNEVGGDFELQSRMVPVGDNVTTNAAIAARLGGAEVMIDGTDADPLTIDGTVTALADGETVAVGDSQVTRQGAAYILVDAGADGTVNDGDTQVRVTMWQDRVDVELNLADALSGQVEGLLGNGDGNPDNDIALADGTPLARPLVFEEVYGAYRDDWRVTSEAESLFTYDAGESLEGFYLPDHPQEMQTLDSLPAAVRADAEQKVQAAGLTPGTLNYRNAVLDVALTGDESFIDSARNTETVSEEDALETVTEGGVALTGDDGPNTLPGTDFADTLVGAGGGDELLGLGRGDILHGNGGSDKLYGDGGDDTIEGGAGADRLYGGTGSDLLNGEGVAPDFDATAWQVFRLYEATLDRTPDQEGHYGWIDRLKSDDFAPLDAAGAFAGSREFEKSYGTLDDGAFVDQLYRNVLGRAASDSEIAGWTDRLDADTTRAEVVLGFSDSLEFINDTATAAMVYSHAGYQAQWTEDVYRLYQATLAREPDKGGLLGWTERLADGTALETAATGFTGGREFEKTYGALGDEGFVQRLYQNVLTRSASEAEVAGWTDRIDAGESRAEVVLGFSQGREFRNKTDAALDAWVTAQGQDDRLEGGAGTNVLFGGALADRFVFAQEAGGTHEVAGLEGWDILDFDGFGYANAAEARTQMSQQGDDVVFADQGVMITFADAQMAEIQNDMIALS